MNFLVKGRSGKKSVISAILLLLFAGVDIN